MSQDGYKYANSAHTESKKPIKKGCLVKLKQQTKKLEIQGCYKYIITSPQKMNI